VMQSGEYLFPSLSLQALHEAARLPIGVGVAPFCKGEWGYRDPGIGQDTGYG